MPTAENMTSEDIEALFEDDEDALTPEEIEAATPPKPVAPKPPEREGIIEWSPGRGQLLRFKVSSDPVLKKLVRRNERVSFVLKKDGRVHSCIQTYAKLANEWLKCCESGKDPSV